MIRTSLTLAAICLSLVVLGAEPSPFDCYPFKSATGELLIDEPWLISPLKFSYNMNTYSAITNTTGSGTITYDSGLAIMESTGAGTATITSGIRAYAEPGQGVSCVFAAAFFNSIDITGVIEIAGVGNDTDGFFFGSVDGLFGILHRNNSVDTFITQNQWNVDKMDGTGTSGIVLDTTLGNIYKIQYLRLEFGNINFYIESAETGQFVLVHQIEYTNNNTAPSLSNPGIQLMAQVSSTGGEIYMELSSMGLYTEGIFNPHLGIRNNISDSNTIDTTIVTTLSIRNDSVFFSITNQLMVFPDQMSILNASDSNTDALFSLYLNPTVDTAPTFFQVNPNSCVSYSIDVSTFSGGTFVGSFGLSNGSSKSIKIEDYGLELSPGDVLVIACSTLADEGTMYASISWLEQF